MQLDFTIRSNFKNLAKWITEEFPKVQHDKPKWNLFKQYAQLNEQDAIEAITINDSSPIIDAAFIGEGIYGEFYRKGKKKNRHKIHLNRHLCREFNKYKELDKLPYKFRLLMEAVLLHEMVHWGDQDDGVRQPNQDVYDTITGKLLKNKDIGFQFEEEAYPGIFMADILKDLGIKIRGLN